MNLALAALDSFISVFSFRQFDLSFLFNNFYLVLRGNVEEVLVMPKANNISYEHPSFGRKCDFCRTFCGQSFRGVNVF